MKIKTEFSVLFIAGILSGTIASGQTSTKSFAGKYSDGFDGLPITELQLIEDGTFKLKTPDPVFPYTYQPYINSGKWIAEDNKVVLNPDKAPRQKEISLRHNNVEGDFVTIRIIYKVKIFINEELKALRSFDFDQLTLYVNKKNKYYNLVRREKRTICAFAPRTKNQHIVDSTNTLVIPRTEIKKLGITTYGFDNVTWLDVADKRSNYFEIEIVQPLDQERTPRSKTVILKGKKAFFYERNGAVDISWLATALTKKESVDEQ